MVLQIGGGTPVVAPSFVRRRHHSSLSRRPGGAMVCCTTWVVAVVMPTAAATGASQRGDWNGSRSRGNGLALGAWRRDGHQLCERTREACMHAHEIPQIQPCYVNARQTKLALAFVVSGRCRTGSSRNRSEGWRKRLTRLILQLACLHLVEELLSVRPDLNRGLGADVLCVSKGEREDHAKFCVAPRQPLPACNAMQLQ